MNDIDHKIQNQFDASEVAYREQCEPCGTGRGEKCWGHCVGPDAGPTDLQIALRSADAGEDGDAGHWPTVAWVLAHEYRKVHAALVKLDGICRHEFGHHGFRQDWLRDAIAGDSESRCEADAPLTIKIEREQIVIRIGIDRLNGNDCHPDLPELLITDRSQWAKDVAYELERDRGDGATPLSLCLDAAMVSALGMGSVAIQRGHALASESQREAAGTADEKPDGQAENVKSDGTAGDGTTDHEQ